MEFKASALILELNIYKANALDSENFLNLIVLTKACPYESGDGYPEILDSSFHGNDSFPSARPQFMAYMELLYQHLLYYLAYKMKFLLSFHILLPNLQF